MSYVRAVALGLLAAVVLACTIMGVGPESRSAAESDFRSGCALFAAIATWALVATLAWP